MIDLSNVGSSGLHICTVCFVLVVFVADCSISIIYILLLPVLVCNRAKGSDDCDNIDNLIFMSTMLSLLLTQLCNKRSYVHDVIIAADTAVQ